jgi:hypothetical protein
MKAQILQILGQRNRLTREEIDSGLTTLARIVPALDGLIGELSHLAAPTGVATSTYEEARQNFGLFLTNSAVLLNSVKQQSPNPKMQAAVAELEDKIVSQYVVFLSPEAGPQTSLDGRAIFAVGLRGSVDSQEIQ